MPKRTQTDIEKEEATVRHAVEMSSQLPFYVPEGVTLLRPPQVNELVLNVKPYLFLFFYF